MQIHRRCSMALHSLRGRLIGHIPWSPGRNARAAAFNIESAHMSKMVTSQHAVRGMAHDNEQPPEDAAVATHADSAVGCMVSAQACIRQHMTGNFASGVSFAAECAGACDELHVAVQSNEFYRTAKRPVHVQQWFLNVGADNPLRLHSLQHRCTS